ncbi:hypothetical protein NB069_17995 [Leclercia adecarboxylata]|uniref:hypothetical protein n=1 Tax=Leclercia adecarboxylata TaxID=83655 RepID=UPI00202A8DFC|nr:hypothetical protein [Leclercia adecarboxylata]URN98541.1 hypothetical protein NB069_17995 [Leclercia adecarboxylata]
MISVAGCSTPKPDKVEQINRLHIPLVLPGAKTLPAPTSHIATLYNTNKRDIETLTDTLKKEYLQDVNPKEIFEMDSDVQPVYASLSRLEALASMNQQYLKDKNEMGLQQIHIVLKPVITG